jgi:hypothetical protein
MRRGREEERERGREGGRDNIQVKLAVLPLRIQVVHDGVSFLFCAFEFHNYVGVAGACCFV